MSTITTDQGILHYEAYGRGRPVILLHGWLGSWYLWQKTMAVLGKSYRTYALEFWGFGESGTKGQSFEMDDYVEMVEQFMEQLGIQHAPVIGHSMGGTVSMDFAIKYPHRVTKVGVIGSPVDGESLTFLLKLSGYQFIANIVHHFLWALKAGVVLFQPFVTKDKNWPEMINKDISKTSMDSFFRSIRSLRKKNITDQIGQINVPFMGIYGKKDVIVNPNQYKLIQEHAQHPHIIYLDDAGHFPMLDDSDKFIHTIKDFLDQPIPSPKDDLEKEEEPLDPLPTIPEKPKEKERKVII